MELNENWINQWVKRSPHLFTRTPYAKVTKVAGKTLAFSPLLFISWEFFNSENLFSSLITCTKDFLWPCAAIIAKCFNASPY